MRAYGTSLVVTAALLRPAFAAVRRGELDGRDVRYSPRNNESSTFTTSTGPISTTSSVNNNGPGFGLPDVSIPVIDFTSSTTSSTLPNFNFTSSTSSILDLTSLTSSSCIQATETTVEIVFTSTIIFTGDPADYTPPYDPIPLPTYCENFSNIPVDPTVTNEHPSQPSKPLVTWSTTEKNPSVIFETNQIPDYTPPPIHGPPGGNQGSGDNTKSRPDSSHTTGHLAPPIFTFTADPSQVIVGSSTISGLKPGQSTTVTVGGGTFTILPTAIIGEGGTVVKPPPVEQPPATFPPQQPTKSNIGGLDVSVSGSLIVADGTTLTVPPQGLTTEIGGEHVSIGPGHLVVGDETMSLPPGTPQSTDVFIVGGGLLTAIDSTIVVLHSTTITYGPDVDLTTIVVDEDTITIDPAGVHVHDSTLGGPGAGPTDTTYTLVGGVTITEIGTTLVVIGDHTYTIGSGASTVTTEIGGEVLTIGPDGVVFGTMTLSSDDNPTVVGTIGAPSTSLEPATSEPGKANNRGGEDGTGDEDDAATIMLVPGFMTVVCIAIGVWGLA